MDLQHFGRLLANSSGHPAEEEKAFFRRLKIIVGRGAADVTGFEILFLSFCALQKLNLDNKKIADYSFFTLLLFGLLKVG
jgi:hypothetical protein